MTAEPNSIECRVSDLTGPQVDTRRDLLVARRAGRQWGVVSADELRGCGLSSREIGVRVRHGHLHRMHRGVYAVGHANPPLEGRFLAAVRACGVGAVLSHMSAGALLELVRWDGRYPEVTVLGTTARTHHGIRLHRTATLAPVDVTWHDGIPITAPARTLVDLASFLDYRALRRATRQAQSLRLVELSQLIPVLRRLGRRRGSRKLARIIATGPAPTRSELEDVVLDLMLGAGLAHPDVNVPIVLAGRLIVPDFRWAPQQLVVETDGAAWHEHKLGREQDAERQALLEAHGEQVMRVTWDQAVTKPGETIARIRGAGAPSGPRVSG